MAFTFSKMFALLDILFLIPRQPERRSCWLQVAVTLLSTMGLSVYSYNSAFLVELKAPTKKTPKTWHIASATLFPQLEHCGSCRPSSLRPSTGASGTDFFFSSHKKWCNRKWGEVKGLQAKLSLNMNCPRGQTFRSRRAWGFLCSWHDNLSANGTARPIVPLIVCLGPLHTAAGMCNLGSSFWQIASWTRQRGATERLILSAGHMGSEGGWVKLIQTCQTVHAVPESFFTWLSVHLNREQGQWFIHYSEDILAQYSREAYFIDVHKLLHNWFLKKVNKYIY